MRVYKFLTADLARKVIAERRLKISEFTDMNDPLELYGLKLSDDEMEGILVSHFLKTYGAVCFSTAWSNPVLWAHYGDKHKGICLGFDLDPVVGIVPTRYVTTKETRDVTQLRVRCEKAILEGTGVEAGDGDLKLVEDKLSTKYVDWRYENEVRVFAELKEKDCGLYFVDFGEDLKLAEVILGVRCCVEISRIQDALAGCVGEIRIVKSVTSPTAFEIVEDAGSTVVVQHAR